MLVAAIVKGDHSLRNVFDDEGAPCEPVAHGAVLSPYDKLHGGGVTDVVLMVSPENFA